MITKEMFEVWMQDEITKEIFSGIQDIKVQIEEGLKSEEIILAKDGQLRLARLLGQRDGLNILLNIEYEEFGNE
jgi:hypothetical protein